MGRIVCSRRPARRRRAVAGLAGLALLTTYAGMSQGSPNRADIPEATVRSLVAINGTGVPDVVQNLVPGAIAARDVAEAAYRAAGPAAHPTARPAAPAARGTRSAGTTASCSGRSWAATRARPAASTPERPR
jgi:hypothetical protein